MSKYTVLVTGVGSLVGKGILDSLDGRRSELRIVGTSFGAMAPGVYRCDEAHLTVDSDDLGFARQLRSIVEQVRPDLVIPGRDPDVPVVIGICEQLGVACLAGCQQAAAVCTDKWRTFEFAREHALAVVPTYAAGTAIAVPAVVKPRTGSGSVGVRVLLTQEHVEAARTLPDVVLQPFIGSPPRPPELAAGWPLFWELPTARQGGVQAVIGPDGAILGTFAFETQHQYGWVVEQHGVDDPQLAALGRRFARTLADAGWRGPLNVACIHDGSQWLCLELNPRFTGGTAARTDMGFDEVGLALNAWAGREVVPARLPRGDIVIRQTSEYPLVRSTVSNFERTGTTLEP